LHRGKSEPPHQFFFLRALVSLELFLESWISLLPAFPCLIQRGHLLNPKVLSLSRIVGFEPMRAQFRICGNCSEDFLKTKIFLIKMVDNGATWSRCGAGRQRQRLATESRNKFV
jgi:hypothetical protein